MRHRECNEIIQENSQKMFILCYIKSNLNTANHSKFLSKINSKRYKEKTFKVSIKLY